MSERLDQIEAQQATNTANITDLITLSGNLLQAAQINAETSQRNAEAITALSVRASESDERFNVLISEMRADRRATRQASQALLLQLAEVNGRLDDIEQA